MLWSSESRDKRWRLTLHRQDIQKVPQRTWSRPPSCHTIPSPDEWPSRNIKQANQEHSAEESKFHGEGMEEKVIQGTMCVSDNLQDSDRDDTLPIGLWQNLPSSG